MIDCNRYIVIRAVALLYSVVLKVPILSSMFSLFKNLEY